MTSSDHQPSRIGEMPHAYIHRVVHRIRSVSEADYRHHQDMLDNLFVFQTGFLSRRSAALRCWSRARTEYVTDIRIGNTDILIDGRVFYRAGGDAEPEILAIYDTRTWEDVIDLVDLDDVESKLPYIDLEAERRDCNADAEMRARRENL